MTSVAAQTRGGLTAEQVAAFHKDGYLHIPNVLTSSQIVELRESAQARFNVAPEKRHPGDLDQVLYDPYNRYPEMRWLLFHDYTNEMLRSLLGNDFVIIRESAIHKTRYSGWHKDTTNQEKKGLKFQWEPDYLMLGTIFYYQDNDPIHGGGLNVEPGSHMRPDRYIDSASPHGLKIFLRKLFKKQNRAYPRITLPTKAGDLIIFHFRLDHQGTPDTCPDPGWIQKMGMFQSYSANTRHYKEYNNYLLTIPDYAYAKGFRWNDGLVKEAERLKLILD
jgi:hypothetical protein